MNYAKELEELAKRMQGDCKDIIDSPHRLAITMVLSAMLFEEHGKGCRSVPIAARVQAFEGMIKAGAAGFGIKAADVRITLGMEELESLLELR